MKKIIVILIFALFTSLYPQISHAKNKGYFSAEVGVKYNIMLNYRAKKQWPDWFFISSKSTDNVSYFGKLYYTYFTKKNKLSFYSGISLQNSPITYKRYYENYTTTGRDIKKDVTNFFEILFIQGIAYQIKKIKIGAEFGYPLFVKDFNYSRLYDKKKDKDGNSDNKWFHPNFCTNIFISEKISIKKYSFNLKQSVEYHLINNYSQDRKRHIMSFLFSVQLPFKLKTN